MKINFNNFLKFMLALSLVVFISCDGEDGVDGFNSLLSTEIEPIGSNCEAGGIKINYGLDLNRNDILDLNEIQNSEYICNGQGGTLELDNLVRLEIPFSNWSYCGTDWFISEHETHFIHHFNKNDYADVSSIIFVPSLYSLDSTNIVFADLYNATDNIPITNSQVEQNNALVYEYKYSENIFENLPDHTITLGIRIKNTSSIYCGGTGINSYLFIFRE